MCKQLFGNYNLSLMVRNYFFRHADLKLLGKHVLKGFSKEKQFGPQTRKKCPLLPLCINKFKMIFESSLS